MDKIKKNDETDCVAVYGARVHNLKNIDAFIPHDKLTVITGLSGSGKSSLAFDTVYAEGQRRYIETFSSYARNMLGALERPDVDKITGLCPVISIEQKTVNKNPRSTIGTITEVYDFLRLLFARIGEAVSYKSGKPMIKYTEEQILKEVARVGEEINRDLADANPLFVSVLNGSFMFTADLMKHVSVPCEISFVKLASYAGTSSTGKVKELVGLNDDITGRTIVIVEDIIDTGLTMERLIETLKARNPKEIRIATLLVKPDKLKVDLDINYIAMSIPNDFIVGYGLDYDGLGRNYRDIYTVIE